MTRGNVGVRACGEAGRHYLEIETLGTDGKPHVVCATGLLDAPSIWSRQTALLGEDPLFEWKETEDGDVRMGPSFFDRCRETGRFSLLLEKEIEGRRIEERLAVEDGGRIHVTVACLPAEGGPRPFLVGRLMTQISFVPDGRAARSTEPLDFAWLPLLHKQKNHVCGDHFFRSPVAAAASNGFFAAMVPDLDLLAAHRTVGHALDLRVTDTLIEAPRLSYGLCPWIPEGHVYAAHPEDLFCAVSGGELKYGFDLFVGTYRDYREVPLRITSYLWERYGRRFFEDIRPQVMPFEEYGRKYVYEDELRKSVKWSGSGGERCAGIDNMDRRGANFHAWENDLNVAYGIRHYGSKWGNKELLDIAEGIIHTFLRSPRRRDAFPCIFNFQTGEYEGTLFWTARSADPFTGYDAAAMGVTAWWSLILYDDFGHDERLLEAAARYADFLAASQLPSGAVPTYFLQSLEPAKQLLQSATTCISGAVLAKVALLTGREKLRKAALAAGRFVLERIIPELLFNDFETYYSCSPKPLHAVDYWTGIRPHCNLSIQWGCDQMLALYRLTGDTRWLESGEYLLGILSLYQQVWDTTLYEEYLFGGFGVMNTDGEWNDGRQARFVPTYADYYTVTGKPEYLERAVAACRASFALCDIPENHENGINRLVLGETINPGRAGCGGAVPGRGYSPENIHHWAADLYAGSSRYKGLWTGMNWSGGGGLAASAFLERHFGSVLLDMRRRKAVGIDGFTAVTRAWEDGLVDVEITSALETLRSPYCARRTCLVRFQGAEPRPLRLVVNGGTAREVTETQRETGLEVEV